jgi:hypothetical protein
MEECEALCSRIGIMAAGALQCLGSIQHLKSRFGAGYLMEINAPESRSADVQQFVRKLYPQSRMEQAHAGRLKYRLPQSGLTLSSVFSSMEQHKKILGITDYSISQCSLEVRSEIWVEYATFYAHNYTHSLFSRWSHLLLRPSRRPFSLIKCPSTTVSARPKPSHEVNHSAARHRPESAVPRDQQTKQQSNLTYRQPAFLLLMEKCSTSHSQFPSI